MTSKLVLIIFISVAAMKSWIDIFGIPQDLSEIIRENAIFGPR